jgi:hypothetical protein
MAFYAFDIENQPAKDRFISALNRERMLLTEIHKMPASKNQ